MNKKLLIVLGLSLLITSSHARLGHLTNQIVQKAYSLQQAVNNYQHGSGYGRHGKRQVQREIRDMQDLLSRLERQIGHGGGHNPPPIHSPITASCGLDVGGNFLRPKSKISCSIYGRGAVSYEIQVGHSIEWQGSLRPHKNSQSFSTDKKRVGGHGVSYFVYVRTQRGQRILVSTLR